MGAFQGYQDFSPSNYRQKGQGVPRKLSNTNSQAEEQNSKAEAPLGSSFGIKVLPMLPSL